MRCMLNELLKDGKLAKGGTAWLKMDGCAKQYKCARAMYFMCQLARDLGITLDQMNEVTSHGKDEADGHGGVIKTWLTNEMRRVELDKGEAPEGGAHEQAAPREVEHREPRVPHLPRSTRG
mmetsp:Transcript_45955/g.150507  ORF Transcript_45955/g.150507 Transcript_45955/m.150507 type:complete len:121 (-) Transcript_45955:703-1065(-)